MALSLEEIFLELTGAEAAEAATHAAAAPVQGEMSMKNVWVIFRKELRSYFASPIAYGIMALFALIFGFFFYSAVKFFQQAAMRSQMMGQSFPMNVNEMIVRPVLMNVSVIGLFLIPMITMRLFAEEKRSGTIELLMTSPIRDIEIILGKWLAAFTLYAAILAVSAVNLMFLFVYGKPDWKPDPDRLSRPAAAGRMPAGDRNVHLHAHAQSDHRGRGRLLRLPAAVGAGVDHVVRGLRQREGARLSLGGDALRVVLEGRARFQGRDLLRFRDLPRALPDGPVHGIAAVEGVT